VSAFYRVREGAGQQADVRGRANVKELWQAGVSASECERIQASARQRGWGACE